MRRLVLALILTIGACSPGTETTTTEVPAASVGTPIEVESVVDGDSVRIVIDGELVEVRLLGINAPERDECWADEARNALSDALTPGDVSILGEERDQYGRRLAYIYSGATSLNHQMVLEGNAIAIAYEHDELPDLLAAEEEAIALERGLWSPTVCGSTLDRFDVRIWAIEADAPGRDDQNPNGEFVAITNEGRDANLTGWMLRDESSAHRYTFSEGFILTAGEIVTVRSGCGEDARPDVYWCADGAVWTNSGDTVLLLDGFGAVVDRVRYLDG